MPGCLPGRIQSRQNDYPQDHHRRAFYWLHASAPEQRSPPRFHRQGLSIFFYRPKWILLHFDASTQKSTNALISLILLIALCFQWFHDFAMTEFKSPHPDHF
jgi:hypothetical protein